MLGAPDKERRVEVREVGRKEVERSEVRRRERVTEEWTRKGIKKGGGAIW